MTVKAFFNKLLNLVKSRLKFDGSSPAVRAVFMQFHM